MANLCSDHNIVLHSGLSAKIAIFLTFWQVDSENRAFSELRIDSHLAAVQERQVLHDREAEPGSAHVAGSRPVNPVKTLEKPLQMLHRDTVAIVLDEDLIARS